MSLFSTKEEYDSMVKNMERKGFKVLTKFRKGIKTVRVADIPLSRDITERTSLAGQNGTLSTQSKDSEEK